MMVMKNGIDGSESIKWAVILAPFTISPKTKVENYVIR